MIEETQPKPSRDAAGNVQALLPGTVGNLWGMDNARMAERWAMA